MATSDSEDFESADEGPNDVNLPKKEHKKRLSSTRSSNYSDCAQDSDVEYKKSVPPSCVKPVTNVVETTDGWDEFDLDIEGNDLTKEDLKEKPTIESTTNKIVSPVNNCEKSAKDFKKDIPVASNKADDSGWDDFDDWGNTDVISNNDDISNLKDPITSKPSNSQPQDIQSIADRLSATSVSEPKSKGWGWGGWGVDSLLNSATAGISSITNHVSQGINTVLETSIGAPDPEELARKNKIYDVEPKTTIKEIPTPDGETLTNVKEDIDPIKQTEEGAFQLGSFISGVSKFVENTGTKVMAGGLDALETIGKKTMEVLQDGDPGLAKKRAMLGLDPGDKIVLSQVLREAKTRADEEDRIMEEKREAKQVHYETLFDDFEGLVHLEALEMLSRQVSMRIEERLRSADLEKRQEIKETLQQVAELCEMPDDDDDEDSSGTPDAFLERLQEATQDLGLKLQFQPLVKQYQEVLSWLSVAGEQTDKAVYKKAVSALAHSTALCVELYHKCGEMLLVKTRRSTADEADALTQMTVVLTRHVSDLATKFTEKLNTMPAENKEQINTYITNVFLEAGNSSSYIQNAFQLALPILQIGAA